MQNCSPVLARVQIREGTVEEHPTWEELIEYENLLDQVKKIQR